MSVTTRDIAFAIAALTAFPLAVNLPAGLAEDGSPHRSLPLFRRGGDSPTQTTALQPR